MYIHYTITLGEDTENQARKELRRNMFQQLVATQNLQLTSPIGLIERHGMYVNKDHSLPSELKNVDQDISASPYPTKMSIESYLPHPSRRLRVRRLVHPQLPWSVSRWIKSFWNGGTTGVRSKFACSISSIRLPILNSFEQYKLFILSCSILFQ